MPWLLASPGHQHPWYWLCRIGISWSHLRKNFNYLYNVEEWLEIWIWATLPKWVPPHIQNWPSPIFMKMHRRIHRCINNRYSKYRHSMNNRFGENELWKVSRASLWHLLGVIEDIDDLILTAFVVKRPSFKKRIHKQEKLLFASPALMPISKSICETIC